MSQFKSSNTRSEAAFYNISGCPEDLFKHMIRLGAYAWELEIASTMECVTFNMDPVLAIETAIKKWSVPEFEDRPEYTVDKVPENLEAEAIDTEELAQYRQDLHYCAEGWRYGLLLYIERVFKWRSDQTAPLKFGFLARKTLNNVRSCRRSLMLQKQLLLPVFLAGCETKDEILRQEVKEYCTWWNEETGYNMILTATGLLEEVWNDRSSDAWWGDVIDQNTRAITGPGPNQYLFG
ncbi:hypothetical protein BDV12DRAFT_175840 [Aspergillus spectabilis]